MRSFLAEVTSWHWHDTLPQFPVLPLPNWIGAGRVWKTLGWRGKSVLFTFHSEMNLGLPSSGWLRRSCHHSQLPDECACMIQMFVAFTLCISGVICFTSYILRYFKWSWESCSKADLQMGYNGVLCNRPLFTSSCQPISSRDCSALSHPSSQPPPFPLPTAE